MYCSGHLRVLIFAYALSLGAIPAPALNARLTNVQPSFAQPQQNTQTSIPTTITLHWAARPGVTHYRLQLASDRSFRDIVLDRLVAGHEYQIDDLAPGKYFWRIASMTTKRGEFSSAATIEVKAQTESVSKGDENLNSRPDRSVNDPRRSKQPASNLVRAGGGWLAAVGEITHPVPAHLRSLDRFELIGVNGEGVLFALDATTGVAVWSRRLQRPGTMRSISAEGRLFLLKSRSGLDNMIVLNGVNVTRIEGATGRDLWQMNLPAVANSGAVLNDQQGAEIFLVDNSLQRLFVLDGNDGNILAQVRLSHRVVGAPAGFVDQGLGRILLAFENGDVEVRGRGGALLRAGSAGSPATTPPLFVRGTRENLVLVGTRSGLTALSADDLRPLGRVAIDGDAQRGNLSAADLNGDGTVEVIMMTEHGRMVVVNATDGKTLWEAAGRSEGEAAAFADLDNDGVLDVLMAAGQTFALALSGRDGSIMWKDDESFVPVANHAPSIAPRTVIAMPFASGTLVIAADPSRTGLRAIEFSARPNH